MTDTTSAAPVAVNPTVSAVVNSVYNNPNVAPQNAASVAASVLNSLAPLLQPALAVSRASPTTSAEIALGWAGLEAILSVFFPHPALAVQQQNQTQAAQLLPPVPQS